MYACVAGESTTSDPAEPASIGLAAEPVSIDLTAEPTAIGLTVESTAIGLTVESASIRDLVDRDPRRRHGTPRRRAPNWLEPVRRRP